VAVKCPRCDSAETSLSWLQDQAVVYWCRSCHKSFDVSRVTIQSRARPDTPPATGAAAAAEPA
jgi:transposase-like protein